MATSILEPSPPLELRVERVMDASAEALFEAWTKELDCWFAVPGSVSMNLQVSSVFFFLTDDGGKRHPHYGRVLRLRHERLIQLTWLSEGTKGAETLLTIELEPQSSGTRLVLTHAGFCDKDSRDDHELMWPILLAHLDRKLMAWESALDALTQRARR